MLFHKGCVYQTKSNSTVYKGTNQNCVLGFCVQVYHMLLLGHLVIRPWMIRCFWPNTKDPWIFTKSIDMIFGTFGTRSRIAFCTTTSQAQIGIGEVESKVPKDFASQQNQMGGFG